MDFWKSRKEEIIKKFNKLFAKTKEKYEFKDFVVGVRIKGIDKEKALEIKNIVRKDLETEIKDKKKDGDVLFTLILDYKKERYYIDIEIKPVYIFGAYNKYCEMPQITWYCPNCRGKGCKECENTGKIFKTSVQDEIAKFTNNVFLADKTILHGAGREDKDAYCIGFRKFMLEISNPKNRNFDLKELENNINSLKTIEVKLFNFCDKQIVKTLKGNKSTKTYIAIIEYEKTPNNDLINDLIGKELELKQKTPNRVVHRRADIIRERKVKILDLKLMEVKDILEYLKTKNNNLDLEEITSKLINKKYMFLELKTEAGAYVKEFVSGDDNRTQPSLSKLLDSNLKVSVLIVSRFEDDF